jgi:hypothetical protein
MVAFLSFLGVAEAQTADVHRLADFVATVRADGNNTALSWVNLAGEDFVLTCSQLVVQVPLAQPGFIPYAPNAVLEVGLGFGLYPTWDTGFGNINYGKKQITFSNTGDNPGSSAVIHLFNLNLPKTFKSFVGYKTKQKGGDLRDILFEPIATGYFVPVPVAAIRIRDTNGLPFPSGKCTLATVRVVP